MIAGRPSVCVVLPTKDEQENIVEVLTRLDQLGVCDAFVVVDDSDDATAERARALATTLQTPTLVYERRGAQRRGGLGTAIIDGWARSESDIVIVMDADLQHPPELVPMLIEESARADLVIATRFNWESVIGGLSPVRRMVSRLAGSLAFRLFPKELGAVSDPMSGFFAVRRSEVDVSKLHPCGYKILLELLGTHPHLRTAEVPFSFGRRLGGESKAGVGEAVRYVRHVIDLRQRVHARSETAEPVEAVTA